MYNRNYRKRNSSEKDKYRDEDKTEQLKRAVRTGMNILAAADNTEKQMLEKFENKGFDADVTDAAMDYLRDKGYLNEARYLKRAVEYYSNTKLFGKRRVMDELRKKGFSRENLSNVDFSEINFGENCSKLIKRYRRSHKIVGFDSENENSDGYELGESGIDIKEEKRKQLEREYAALLRYGFSGADIRDAYKNIKDTNEENS